LGLGDLEIQAVWPDQCEAVFAGATPTGPSKYYRARYYDPKIGRFLSEDPIGFDSRDPNFYAYVKNNPVNAIDPTGLLGIDQKCAEMVAAKIIPTFGPGDNDKYKHCVVSCYIDVTCDKTTAQAAGIGKEIKDIFGPGNAEWADWQADKEGIRCGENIKKNKKGTCEKPCRQKHP
jgi:RHS repeat-associated protein